MSPTTQTPTRAASLFDSCHRKMRLIGGGPVAFLGGLVAKARRKERDGDQNATDTKLYLEESVLERKLPDADLKALVDLPAGLDYNEWLASHTLALFEHVNLVYGTISEFCTTSGCADMTGPGNRTYLWFDEKGKKTRVAAPQYIDYVMTFTQKTVSDESIFPTKYANEFPGSFESIARKILRLLFHVIAHLYAAHFREIALLGLHTHLNLTFAHLTALHRRFTLIDEKETDVLRDLEVALRLTDDAGAAQSQSPTTTASSSTANGHHDTMTTTSASATSCCIANSTTLSLTTTTTELTALTSASASTDFNNQALIDVSQTTTTSASASTEQQRSNRAVFSGTGGLIGGILGDVSAGVVEYGGDSSMTRYCATTRTATATAPNGINNNNNHNSNSNGGAGSNNSNSNVNASTATANNNQTHVYYPQAAHSGLIQCNAAPRAANHALTLTSTSATATTTTNQEQ